MSWHCLDWVLFSSLIILLAYFQLFFFQLFLNYFSSRAIIVVAKCRWAINHGFAEFTTG